MQLILFASSITIFEVICCFQELGIECPGVGALKYESDVQVPTGERKWGHSV